jgi:hypothetical protein
MHIETINYITPKERVELQSVDYAVANYTLHFMYTYIILFI